MTVEHVAHSRNMSIQQHKATVKDYMKVVKSGIIQSNLITAFTGGFLAIMLSDQSFLQSLTTMCLMMVGVAMIIGGVCVWNNYYDQDIDQLMNSKTNRPSINGTFSDSFLFKFGLSLMLFGELLLFMINPISGLIGFLGIFSYFVLYSVFTKRHFVSNTIVGSISGAIPPLIGFAAIYNGLTLEAWVLFLIMFVWQPPHFYALAIKRRQEYGAAGVPMLPTVYGFKRARISIMFWLLLLLPIPFLIPSLGSLFLVVMTVLNLIWIAIGMTGFKQSVNEEKWAMRMFLFSLNYMIITFVMVVVISLIEMI